MPPDTAAARPAATGLSTPLVLLLATGCGLAVACLYYAQPLLGVLGAEFDGAARIGLVPMLTQLGYAIGLFFLAPLGDRVDRRGLIMVKCGALCVALLACAAAPSLATLLAASLAIGITATVAQDLVPAAATLAPEAHRGRVVGMVMTGLLTGILLSRVASGFLAAAAGWRSVYVAAAISIVVFAVAARRVLPSFAPTTTLPYTRLIASAADLWRRHPALRRATFAQALLSLGFSAFWSTLAIVLHGAPWHLGSAAAGAFGLAGAAGALAAPIAGRIADRRGPGVVTRVGTALDALAFLVMGAAASLPPALQLPVLVLGTIVFDFGIQAALIAHQTIVYGLEPPARSRLNAVLFSGNFLGMASGAALGSLALAQGGWLGVMGLATAASIAAFVIRLRA